MTCSLRLTAHHDVQPQPIKGVKYEAHETLEKYKRSSFDHSLMLFSGLLLHSSLVVAAPMSSEKRYWRDQMKVWADQCKQERAEGNVKLPRAYYWCEGGIQVVCKANGDLQNVKCGGQYEEWPFSTPYSRGG